MAKIQSISFESQSMWVPKIDAPSSNSVQGKLEFPVLMNVSFREGFRMLLGVRKCPENESLLLWAVAMGISVGGLVCWGPLERGLAGRRLTSVYCVVSVSA